MSNDSLPSSTSKRVFKRIIDGETGEPVGVEIVKCHVCGAMYAINANTGEVYGGVVPMGDGRYVCAEHLPPSSKLHEGCWLFAERKNGEYPDPTERNGKWLIFCERGEVDALWDKIKNATEEGRLGDASKVSTPMPSEHRSNPDRHVICVYTYDYEDREDVMRIRDELRKLGVTMKIPYKSDEDTLQGKYSVTGHRRISKYYE